MELPDGVFAVKWNPDLVHQVTTSMRANRRAPLAHAKGKGEVSGGGKKPWKQKGTGRARHGSTRSPIWVGGGVTFGPTKERNFEKKTNKKMKIKALYSVLSKKLGEGEITVVDNFGVTKPSTKGIAEMLKALRGGERKISKTLCVAKEGDKNSVLSGRNIEKNSVIYPNGLNTEACLAVKQVIFEQKALEEFIEKQTKHEDI